MLCLLCFLTVSSRLCCDSLFLRLYYYMVFNFLQNVDQNKSGIQCITLSLDVQYYISTLYTSIQSPNHFSDKFHSRIQSVEISGIDGVSGLSLDCHGFFRLQSFFWFLCKLLRPQYEKFLLDLSWRKTVRIKRRPVDTW